MRGTREIPITMLRLFLQKHPDPNETTNAEKEEFFHLAKNSLGPWLNEILAPLRPKYDQVRRVVDPGNTRIDDWCHGTCSDDFSLNSFYVWAGFPQKNKLGSCGTMFGMNAGVAKSSRIIIGFSIQREYVFKESFDDDEFIPWCHEKLPQIERRLDECLRREEMRESR